MICAILNVVWNIWLLHSQTVVDDNIITYISTSTINTQFSIV